MDFLSTGRGGGAHGEMGPHHFPSNVIRFEAHDFFFCKVASEVLYMGVGPTGHVPLQINDTS